jgi:hypothetical protein
MVQRDFSVSGSVHGILLIQGISVYFYVLENYQVLEEF